MSLGRLRRLASKGTGRTVILAAVLLLALLAGSYAFDRDQNGTDDGGLDLSPAPLLAISLPEFGGLVSKARTFPDVVTHPGSRSAPRSPPRPGFLVQSRTPRSPAFRSLA